MSLGCSTAVEEQAPKATESLINAGEGNTFTYTFSLKVVDGQAQVGTDDRRQVSDDRNTTTGEIVTMDGPNGFPDPNVLALNGRGDSQTTAIQGFFVESVGKVCVKAFEVNLQHRILGPLYGLEQTFGSSGPAGSFYCVANPQAGMTY
jgi:hypothetical protein